MTKPLSWASILFSGQDASACWPAILSKLCHSATCAGDAADLENVIATGDQLLADAAWSLWTRYGEAPSAAARLIEWWNASGSATGRAALILDGLSIRQMSALVAAAKARNIPVESVEVLASCVPSDTEAFARALGLSQRSQLKKDAPPAGFACASSDLQVGLTEGLNFGSIADMIKAKRDVFLWDPWFDDLLHQHQDKPSGPQHVHAVAGQVLSGDDFWNAVSSLRQGRRLVITSDHGYALSRHFGELPSSLGEAMRASFGAGRCGDAPAEAPTMAAGQPLCHANGGRAAVIGPWKWKVQGGFPYLSHGGLSLGETSIPFVTFAAA